MLSNAKYFVSGIARYYVIVNYASCMIYSYYDPMIIMAEFDFGGSK